MKNGIAFSLEMMTNGYILVKCIFIQCLVITVNISFVKLDIHSDDGTTSKEELQYFKI